MAAEAGPARPPALRRPLSKRAGLSSPTATAAAAATSFGDNGTDLGSAPDLTGWGSREWLVGIITDPTHERFYGDSNDRMPSFGKADEGAAPMLTPQQIGLLADWLRGDWYRP